MKSSSDNSTPKAKKEKKKGKKKEKRDKTEKSLVITSPVPADTRTQARNALSPRGETKDQALLGGKWTHIEPSASSAEIPKRYGQTLTPYGQQLFLFGGCNDQGSFHNQLFCFDLEKNRWEEEPVEGGPCVRHFHVAVYYEGCIYIHGGKSNGYNADIFRYEIGKKRWSELKSSSPPDRVPSARFGHSALELDGNIYIYGGYDQHGFHIDDINRYHINDRSWNKVVLAPKSATPTSRFHHSSCLYSRCMYIFGGKNSTHTFADLWEFHFDTKTWTELQTTGQSPSQRWGHSACVLGDNMYIFGGSDQNANFSELYTYNFPTRKWRIIEVRSCPSSRYFHSAGTIEYNNHLSLFMFGGKNLFSSFLNDLHIFQIGGNTDDQSSQLRPSSPAMTVQDPIKPLPFNQKNSYRDSGSGISSFATGNLSPASNSAMMNQSTSTGVSTSSSGDSFGPASPSLNSKRLSDNKIRLKCHFEEEIRMLRVDRTIRFLEFMDQLRSEYNNNLRIEYHDSEGDKITIRSQDDLEEAFNSLTSNETTLRIYLTTAQSRDSSLGSPQASKKDLRKDSMEARRKSKSPRNSLLAAASDQLSVLGNSQGSPTSSIALSQIPRQREIIKWQKGALLGKGGFGMVFLGMNCDTGELLAVKQVSLTGTQAEASAVSTLQREIDLMAPLSHPHIVRYLGSERIENTLNIFLEYVPGGSIASLLSKFKRFPEKVIRSFSRQILIGLDYLHSKGIAHRDIKGANLLVDNSGNIKLADFGASKQLNGISSYSGEGFKTITGTPYFMAPEVIQGQSNYGRKADIWSVGAAVIEMATGLPPWHDLEPVPALFKIGSPDTIPDIPEFLSEEAKAFLILCFQRDPKKRPSSADLLRSSPFVQSDANSKRLSGSNQAQGSIFTFQAQEEKILPVSPTNNNHKRSDSIYDSSSSYYNSGNDHDSLNERTIVSYLQEREKTITTNSFQALSNGS